MRDEHDRVALIIQDQFTKWLQGFPCKSKNAVETLRALQFLLGEIKAKFIYIDGSPEFEAAIKEMQTCHDQATPHRPSTNGAAERGATSERRHIVRVNAKWL